MVDNQSSSRIKRKKGWHLTLWQPSITWLVEDHDRKNKNFVFIIGKRAKNSRDFRKGQNGQIPSILEIFCPKTLFRNNIVIYHFLWYSSLVSSSTIFFNTMWPNEMESLIKKKKNFGHLVLELGGLEYCSWYPSPSSSGTILWMCFLWTAHILKPKILTSGSLRKAKRILNNHSMRATISLTC